MGRKLFIVSSIACILVVLSCVFCDPPTANGINVGKSSEGLSTASDTVVKESEAISIDGFSAEQLNTLRQQAEKREFQAEVNRMMKLIINSLYKNKEIFLRELISNASDALDKIRLLSLTDKDALNATEELSIRIKVNKEARTMHIIDTGVGMSKEDLAVNLGTIAQSGTSDFLAKLASSQSSQDADLIGQFGVGFYSGFLVSKRIMVISKMNNHPQCIWESDSKSFKLIEDPRGDTLKRGTEIILFLNEEASDYLQQDTLTSVIKKYSQFINFPIYLWSSRVESVKVDSPEAVDEKAPSEDAEASVEEEKKDKPKTVEKTIWDWVHVNKYKPIWKRNPSDITEDEYKDLYKDLSLDQDEPLAKVHFNAEGDVSFTALLYLPKRSPGDIFNVNYSYKNRIKLHVHRIFISDAAEELVPKFLGFVIGIVDSDDLPLNVSRETLQQNELVKVIRKKLTRKVIEMISKMSEEDFDKFWKEYSIHIKLGMIEDASNKSKLSKLLRYRTSKSNDTFISLMDYKSRMKKDQDAIYYLTGASLKEVKSSPLVERLVKMGYEVIFMIDAIDEYVMQSLTEFEKLPLQNVAKEGVKLKTPDTLKETQQKDYEKLLTWLKEDALKDKIEKAELSERLSDSPCALVASKYGWSGNMERIMRSQAHHKGDDLSSNYYSTMAKTFEINPRHPIIKKMNHRVKIDSSDREARETAELLFYVATLRSGYTIHDSVDFAQKIELIMRKNLDVDELEEVEAEPEETDDENKAAEEHKTDEDVEEDVSRASDEPAATDITHETPSDDTNQSCSTCRRLLQHAEAASKITTNPELDEDDTAVDQTGDDEADEADEDDDFHIIGARKLLAVKPSLPTASTKKMKTVTPPTVPQKKNVVKPTTIPTTTPKHKTKTVKLMETKPMPSPTHKLSTKSKKVNVKREDSDDLNFQAFQSVLKKPAPKPKPKVVRVVGTPNDHDCDGIPDDIDEDIDNDGLLDRTQDSDWDGELNHVDLDDDNDGILDVDDEDANGDGIPDCRADTSDHQLVVRFKKKKRTVDSDFDGIPDDVDKDDDDDGIPDIMEDDDGDQIPDWFNISLQDIEAEEDLHQLTKRMAKYGWHDHDCDGIPDDLDPDDDNDGFFDNKQDSDRDGILNEWDDDDDNDGIPDSEDPDSNGDGIPDCVIKDTDGDGIPDHIDTDDDNDGIPDLQDPDHPTFNYFKDSDNDGIPDILDKDDDNDGIPDHNDQDADGDGTHDYFQDIDKDGVPDALDDDMDNDGIPDHQQDHDCDGIPDIIDPDDDNDGYFDNKQDSDNDGILNEWDDDDDNDGIPDKDDPDSNGDGILDCQPRDSDGDGIPDHLDDDDDNDGIPDIRDPDSISFLLYKHKRFLEAIPAELARNQQNLMNVDLGDPNDKDCDGIPDHLDNDQDNDGKIDRTQDSDMDGMLNHVDDDDDNDGIPDHLDPDANGDGIPDCRRDDDLHYKLVKSPSGLIKKVLRIRKPTQEEQHMAFMVNEAKRKLIKVRAMLNSPPPKKPLQTAHSIKSTTLKPEHNAAQATTKPIHPKILKTASPSGQNSKAGKQPKIPDVKTQKTAVSPKPVVTKTVQQANNPPRAARKLAGYTPNANEYSVEETVENKWNPDEEEEEEDDLVDLIANPEEESRSGSFLFPGAMATDAQTIKKATLQKTKLEAQMKKLKPKKPIEVKKPTKPTVAPTPTISKTASAAKKLQTCSAPSCQSRPGTRSTGGVLPLPATKQKPQVFTKGGPTRVQYDDDDNDDEDEYLEDEDDDGIPDYLEGDSDGDGIPDYLEDEDGDGIPDYLEDEDGDGIPDYLDEDSSYRLGKLSEDLDGDGIPDHLEGDSDGDGILDYQEDSDGDGIPDYLEDFDGDGIPDYLDVDSPSQFNPKRIKRTKRVMRLHRDLDNDNIPDLLEGDLDGDGVPDYLEDEDDDGIPDYLEDEDGDGIPDYLDEDSTYRRIRLFNDADEDGIPDHLEGDSDGDGIPDYMEDSDGDGIPDYLEDSDGDGIPNYLDVDSELSLGSKKSKRGRRTKPLDFDLDHDGIPDFLEGDSDGNGVPDYLEDSDGDGVPDYLEDSDGDGIPDYQDEDATSKFSVKKVREIKARQKVGDLDGDGIPDHLQGDSDGDGIPDYQEDTDGDGIPDYLEDSDGDGIPDYLDEDAKTQFSPKVFKRLEELKKKEDEDGDGIPDYLEGDSDGDGTPDYLEDSDGDGIPDYLEDSDGDGIPDYLDEDSALQKSKSIFKIEDKNRNGIPDHLEHDSDYDGTPDYLEDTDKDGIPDYLEDSDEDGIPDYLDEDATTQFSPKKIRGRARGKKFADADHDGIPDHLEGDMDNNGILDYLEDADGDNIPDYLEDTDKDGIPDYLDEDATTKFAPKTLRKMRPQRHYADVDGDGIPDHLELDNDGDGIPDYLEDTDGDGIPDYLEDSDGDGIPDYIDEDAVSQFSQRNYRRLKITTQFEDNDGDGIPDHLQGDSDGDGVLDFLEDSDGDGTPDYLEDSDGDGVPDYLDQDADSQFSPKFFTDKNRDGIPDSLEGDSDGDGIPDYLEDTDGDGIPDYLEDSDGDGIPNYLDKDVVDVETEAVVEGFDSDTNKNGIPDYLEDWDADGIPNYLDDDDGDGIADFLDRKDNRLKAKKKKGKYRKPIAGDKNENGIPDYLEGDSDGDGVLDYKQDTDKDGIPDYLDEDDVNAKFRKAKSMPIQKARQKFTKTPKSPPTVRGKIDTDGDGIPDDEEDADGDGIPDYLDSDADGDGKPDDHVKVVDRNGNGIPDHLELKDSDGDGIIDLEDDDDDNDGIPDDEDDDDDNDGIKDYLEDENHNQKLDILEAKDTDGDGIPDYLDDDDDNDGIPDSEDDDDDGDGIVDKLEDENKNQIPDYLEMRDSDGDGIVDWLDTDDDNDNIPDYLDDDDDGDGIPDTEEDENKNNIPDILELQMKGRKPPSTPLKKTTLKSKQEPAMRKKTKVTIPDKENDDSDDDEDEEEEESRSAEYQDNDDEDDHTSQSSFRTNVNRVLRWIESIVGVENSSS